MKQLFVILCLTGIIGLFSVSAETVRNRTVTEEVSATKQKCGNCGGELQAAVIKVKKQCPVCHGEGTVRQTDSNGRSKQVRCTMKHDGKDMNLGYFVYVPKTGLKCENCGAEYLGGRRVK